MAEELGPRHSDPVVELHRDDLINQARLIAQSRPGLRVIGLVADADTPEARFFEESKAEVYRVQDGSMSALITRESAKQRIREERAAGLLDWLEDEGEGNRRKLTVIHSAKRGMRTVTFMYDLVP